ncbi:MAG TPA: phosphoribosyltransferase family protein [Terriglobales bacterium]|nr:phosphoribosyltransferase family protein [Terriglobales bacterium]
MLTPSTSDIVISSEQIQKRVREMARQITHDYAGKTIHALAVLENGFIFLSDLVRAIDLPVVCQFIKPQYRDDLGGMLEIFFSHDIAVQDQHILLVEGILHSGVTTEFLLNDLHGRGAATVKTAALLDRQCARRVQLQPDYFGFLVDNTYLMGYGLGSPEQTNRNLPYLLVSK